MKIEIRNRFTNEIIYECEAKSLRDALEECARLGRNLSRAYLSGANLSGANLYGANLSRADLYGANLSDANLSGANLSGANLSGANLSGANLYGANLSRADLYGANLYGANLSDANLSGANLSDANLSGANLSGANLYGANLSDANLSGANLSGANLYGAKDADLAIAQTRILPEGSIIGYKKVRTPEGTGIVVLKIPTYAKRSHAFGRKCRCEFAEVIEAPEGAFTSERGPRTEYKVGEIVKPDKWDDNWQDECSNGIHFFITRLEADNYQ